MIYCYLCTKCKKKVQKSMSMNDFMKEIPCECGGVMGIDIAEQQKGRPDTPSNWPMESDAAGVHPDQVKDAAEYAMKMGVPTEYNPETGNPFFTSQRHRKRFCEISGLYDRNAGYGDATPRNNMRKPRIRRSHAGRN